MAENQICPVSLRWNNNMCSSV